MRAKERLTQLLIVGLIIVVAVAFIVEPLAGVLAKAQNNTSGGSPALEQNITMANFYDGHVIYSKYEQGYFIGSPDGVPQLGIKPTIYPNSSSSQEDSMYVLVPWWGPKSEPYLPAYDPSAYGISLDCDPANNTTTCFDHPLNLYVPGLGVVPLPGHDHLLPSTDNYRDIWWQVYVVLVFNQSAFPASPNSTAGITSMSALSQAENSGMASQPLPTNIFLNFQVLQPGRQ
ncbi:MAG: hypothetical protein QXP70_05655 [Methanomassiliicoccales archaeon]